MMSVEELARRAAERTPWLEIGTGRPDGPAWFALADIDGLPAREWYRQLLNGSGKGKRDVAGAYLASHLVDMFAAPAASVLVHDGATWPVRADALRVRRDDGGWFDALAIGTDEVWQAGGEPFATEGELFEAVAAGIVAIAAPWFDTVRTLAPYGRIGMWGMLADCIGSAAVRPVRTEPVAAARAWARAQELLDRIADLAPGMRARPGLRTIAWSGGEACLATQGTCCLYYKVHDAAGGGEPYCLGCPLRPEGECDPLYADYLEREHGTAPTT